MRQLSRLIKQLEFPSDERMKSYLQNLKEMYNENQNQFILDMRNYLTKESDLVKDAKDHAIRMNFEEGESSDEDQERQIILTKQKIEDGLEELKSVITGVQRSMNLLKNSSNAQEKFSYSSGSSAKRQKMDESANLELEERNVYEILVKGVDLCTEVQNDLVLTEVKQWKRRQQLAQNGVPFRDNLGDIEKWCHFLCTSLSSIDECLKSFSEIRQAPQGESENPSILDLQAHVQKQLTNLIKATLLVVKQPEQIIKKDKQFSATLQWLVADWLKNASGPAVHSYIISEEEARRMTDGDISMLTASKKDNLMNAKSSFKNKKIPDSDSGQWVCHLEKLKVKEIQRGVKSESDNETVLAKKFAVLFKTTCTVRNGSKIDVWAMSLPVLYLTHTMQLPSALPVILWDNHFAEQDRRLFDVPKSVKWRKFVQMLNLKFKEETGKSLSQQHQTFLAQKLLGQSNCYRNIEVTWQKFYEEHLEGCPFSFWEWFYEIMKLTKDYLRDPWIQNHIIGFISKQDTEKMLLQQSAGTFLLRFSEQTLGGLSAALVAQKQKGSKRLKCKHFVPFEASVLKKNSLSSIICGTPDYLFLYPDIPKLDAFQHTELPNTDDLPKPDGYIGYNMLVSMQELNISGDSVEGDEMMYEQVSVSPGVKTESPEALPPQCMQRSQNPEETERVTMTTESENNLGNHFLSDFPVSEGSVIYDDPWMLPNNYVPIEEEALEEFDPGMLTLGPSYAY